jgi:hypothetical protein
MFRMARNLAVALAFAVGAAHSSACTSSRCVCPSPDATIDSTPIAAKSLDLAFEFWRTVTDRWRCGRISFDLAFGDGLGQGIGRRRPPLRVSEAKLLEELAAREGEIAASLPAARLPVSDRAASTSIRREPLNFSFDFSGKFQQHYVGRIRVEDDRHFHHFGDEQSELREEELLGQLASCEQVIARELAGQLETADASTEGAAARESDLVDAVAPRDVHAAIIAILDREPQRTLAPSEVAIARVLARLDDAAYDPWADRPGRAVVGALEQDPTDAFALRYDPAPLELTFGYSRHSLDFASAGEEFRCRCAEATQLSGHPAMNEDQVLAELDAVEECIAADLGFPLPASIPASAPESGPELRKRFDDRPLNFGWSGMTIAEQTGATTRFRTITGVAMRFQDEVFTTGIGFSR